MIKKVIKHYETIFIVDSLLEDEKLDKIIDKYSNFLTKNGASVEKIDKWGRKKFSYQIRKKQSGHFASIEFKGPSALISKLERTYHLDDNILRFLTIYYDKKSLAMRDVYIEKKQLDLANKEKEAAARETVETGVSQEQEKQK